MTVLHFLQLLLDILLLCLSVSSLDSESLLCLATALSDLISWFYLCLIVLLSRLVAGRLHFPPICIILNSCILHLPALHLLLTMFVIVLILLLLVLLLDGRLRIGCLVVLVVGLHFGYLDQLLGLDLGDDVGG